MPIAVGDTFPSVTLKRLGPSGMESVDTHALMQGKTVVLFSVPGAFTPTCSAKHLPGFVAKADELRAKGADLVVCTAVNDPFVMKVWGEQAEVGDAVYMLPDGNGELARALDLTMDASGHGLGHRGRRFSMIIRDGKIADLAVEEAGQFDASSAERTLARL